MGARLSNSRKVWPHQAVSTLQVEAKGQLKSVEA